MATKDVFLKVRVDADHYPLVVGRIKSLREVLSVVEIEEDMENDDGKSNDQKTI